MLLNVSSSHNPIIFLTDYCTSGAHWQPPEHRRSETRTGHSPGRRRVGYQSTDGPLQPQASVPKFWHGPPGGIYTSAEQSGGAGC